MCWDVKAITPQMDAQLVATVGPREDEGIRTGAHLAAPRSGVDMALVIGAKVEGPAYESQTQLI